VLELFHDFQAVLDNCVDATTIDVIVKRRWVANLPKTYAERLQRAESVDVEQVLMVEFTPEGVAEMPAEGLWMMGGNHHCAALKMYVDDLEAKFEVAKEQASQLRREANEGGNILGTSAAAEKVQQTVQEYEKRIT
jgi:hypothetical protein